jgi:ABC-type glycerol-3-phosphate transport system permease component
MSTVQLSTARTRPRRRTRTGIMARRLGAYAVLIVGGLVMMIPFFWMLLTSLKTRAEVFGSPPLSLPSGPHWENYERMWNAFGDVTFGTFFLNSLKIATLSRSRSSRSAAGGSWSAS